MDNKPSPWHLLIALGLTVQMTLWLSCSQPFHETEEGAESMRGLLTEKFGDNVRMCDLSLFHDRTVGNSISAMVRIDDRPNMMANWVYLHTPLQVGRQPLANRGFGRFKIGAFGSWDKRNEQFIDPGHHRFFGIDEVRWDIISTLFIKVEDDMKARGVPNPVLQLIHFSKFSGQVTATVVATTMGGGSSLSYEFDMDGNMIRPPS